MERQIEDQRSAQVFRMLSRDEKEHLERLSLFLEREYRPSGLERTFSLPLTIHSSGQQDSDQRSYDPAEESDQWIQNTQIEETDDDEESVRFQASEEVLGSFRCDSHEYLDPSRVG